ncbi:U-box domain-containing protein [Podospora conica]|nr:U-box domain-containing protein [Schizothecium conicum]
MSESAKWILLKQDGNKKFQAGDWEGAEALYTKALIVNPDSPVLYTNRTMARLKMKMWEAAISDCNECLRIFPDNMKAHYYLGQAHLELANYDEALEHAQRAYKLCVNTHDKSLSAALAMVRLCKSKRWDDSERRRRREYADLEGEVMALLERERDEAANVMAVDEGAAQERGDDAAIRAEWETKLQAMRDVFEKARSAESKRRNVPDWAIDDISFEFMHDPVVTKSGKSYERAVLLNHLQQSQLDPLTREPLKPADLRPNLTLKQALDDFLEENGWAVDY